jgi:hypothetical protein
MTSRCVREEDLLRLFDGELTENEADRLRRHLASCGVCAARSRAVQETVEELRSPLADIDAKAIVDDVMRRLPGTAEAHRTRARWSRPGWMAMGGAIAAAAAIVAVVAGSWPRAANEEFAARGTGMGMSMSRAVGVTVHRVGSVEPLAEGAPVRPDDAYALTYRNLLSAPVYLLAFAVDAANTVHWICPEYLDPSTNPSACSLAPASGETALPSGVQLEAPAAGRMRVIGVLSHAPHHVLDVDRLPTGDLALGALRTRWPEDEVRDLVTVDVGESRGKSR